MKTTLRILVILTLSLMMNACNLSSPNTSNKTTLYLNLQEGDPPSLNPYVGVDLRSRCLYLTLFEPLMRQGGNGELTPAAASSYEISPDGKTYTFHLRSHKWSDGTFVTSHDFANAWRFALDSNTPARKPELFYPICGAEQAKKGECSVNAVGIFTPDNHTLVVKLKHRTPYFLNLVATSFFLPLKRPSTQEPSCFNGPYVVGKHIADKSLTLVKNPSYWDRESLSIEAIHFTMIKDPMTAYLCYEKGELDAIGDPFCTLPFEVVQSLQGTPTLNSKTVSRLFYLLINTQHAALKNPNIRKALSLSIDREAFTKHLFVGQIPTMSLLPTPLSTLTATSLYFDKEAKHYFAQGLQELNLTQKSFPPITLSYAELTGQKKMAEFVQESWEKALGIQIRLRASEWNVHSAQLKTRDFEIGALHLTTLFQDPMFYFDLFRDKTSPANYCQWESAPFKELLEKAMQCQEQRELFLQQAEEHLLEHMPAIALFTHNFQYLQKEGVDVPLTELGVYDFKAAKKESR